MFIIYFQRKYIFVYRRQGLQIIPEFIRNIQNSRVAVVNAAAAVIIRWLNKIELPFAAGIVYRLGPGNVRRIRNVESFDEGIAPKKTPGRIAPDIIKNDIGIIVFPQCEFIG
jgi:hypothetical protein